MKSLYSYPSALLRCVISITVGAILIIFPSESKELIVSVIGILLMIPSVVTIIPLFVVKNEEETPAKKIMMLLSTIGMAIIGLIMIIYPQSFVALFMLFIGILLFLSSIIQIIGIFKFCKTNKNYWLMIVPLIVMVTGIVTIVLFETISTILFIVIGGVLLLYGISEMLNYYKLLNDYNLSLKKISETIEITE